MNALAVRLIDQAEHFIYIENQFFVSAYGRAGFGDDVPDASAPGPSAEVRLATSSAKKYGSRAAWGDSGALPTNRICEALGEKLGDMILDVGHASPDGKASPFHVYITPPVHSEGRLDDPSTMTQVHNTDAFAFIPANGRSIWPTITMRDGKRAGGLMPFDAAFWASPHHSPEAAARLARIKGYITQLPWRWPVVSQRSLEVLQNNDSGLHSALFVGNEAVPAHDDKATRLSSTHPASRDEYPA